MLETPRCLRHRVAGICSDAVVLADARATSLLASASLAVVLADARATAFLARASSAVVLTDTCATAGEALGVQAFQ